VSVDRPTVLAAFVAVLALQILVTLTVLPPLAASGLAGSAQVVLVALLSIALRVWLGVWIARRALRRGGGGRGAIPIVVPSVALGAAAGYLLTGVGSWFLVELPGTFGGWFTELARTLTGVAVTAVPLALGAWWHVRSAAGDRGRGSRGPR